jgi:hypothetical protein
MVRCYDLVNSSIHKNYVQTSADSSHSQVSGFYLLIHFSLWFRISLYWFRSLFLPVKSVLAVHRSYSFFSKGNSPLHTTYAQTTVEDSHIHVSGSHVFNSVSCWFRRYFIVLRSLLFPLKRRLSNTKANTPLHTTYVQTTAENSHIHVSGLYPLIWKFCWFRRYFIVLRNFFPLLQNHSSNTNGNTPLQTTYAQTTAEKLYIHVSELSLLNKFSFGFRRSFIMLRSLFFHLKSISSYTKSNCSLHTTYAQTTAEDSHNHVSG